MVGAACALATAFLVNIPIRSTTDETYANFGTELLRLERPLEAIPFLVHAVNLLPDNAAAHRDLALAYLKSGDSVSAVREYTTVARLEPESPANHRELAVAAEAAGDRIAALASLREAVRLEPSNAATYVKLGDLFVRLERPIDARQTYEAGVALKAVGHVESVGLRARLASLDIAEGHVRQALARLEEAAATARSSGQGDIAKDVEATIRVLRGRLKPGE